MREDELQALFYRKILIVHILILKQEKSRI